MSYPAKVEQHHRLMYAQSVKLVTQQRTNKIATAVTVVPASGEAQSVTDLVGQIGYVRGEARTRRNVENPVSGSRRWVVYPEDIKSGQYIDREDKFKTATDPTSVYVTAHTAAVTRGQMDAMLGIEPDGAGGFAITGGGVYGVAREGKTPGVGTALPASQYIAHGSARLTLAKIIAAVELMQLADFGIDDELDPIYGLITPKQKTDLINIAANAPGQVNAFDVKTLESGKPTMLMGVNWIMSNRVPKNAAGNRLVGLWSKSNIIAGEWEGINGDMWNDTSADNLPYARVRTKIDCVRGEDKGVVVIECNE